MFASKYRLSFAAAWKGQLVVAISVLLILVAANVYGQAIQPKEKNGTKTIKGTVVAESMDLANGICWHVCSLNLVVMTQDSGEGKFVRVNVEYSDEGSQPERPDPSQLLAPGKVWKLNGIIDKPAGQLNQFVRIVDQDRKEGAKERTLPAWRMLNGFENVTLPFGKDVPYMHVRLNDSFTEINN